MITIEDVEKYEEKFKDYDLFLKIRERIKNKMFKNEDFDDEEKTLIVMLFISFRHKYEEIDNLIISILGGLGYEKYSGTYADLTTIFVNSLDKVMLRTINIFLSNLVEIEKE